MTTTTMKKILKKWLSKRRDLKEHRKPFDPDNPIKPNSHIYLYTIKGDYICYERSFPRDYPQGAVRRVEELRKRGIESFYVIGATLKGTFY